MSWLKNTRVLLVPRKTIDRKVENNNYIGFIQYEGYPKRNIPPKVKKLIESGKISGGRVIPYYRKGWKSTIFVENTKKKPYHESLVHEVAHATHPKWSEKQVRRYIGEKVVGGHVKKTLSDIGYTHSVSSPRNFYIRSQKEKTFDKRYLIGARQIHIERKV